MECREIIESDMNKGYINLINQLSLTAYGCYPLFSKFVKNLNERHKVWVIEEYQQIIGTITVWIEPKVIHGYNNVCHIEDVVVDEKHQKKGLGKKLMNKAINYAKEMKCYKVILDCSHKNVQFYKKCGFIKNESQMALKLRD